MVAPQEGPPSTFFGTFKTLNKTRIVYGALFGFFALVGMLIILCVLDIVSHFEQVIVLEKQDRYLIYK